MQTHFFFKINTVGNCKYLVIILNTELVKVMDVLI